MNRRGAIIAALAAVCLLSACAADPVTSAWYAENPRTWRAESPARMMVWDMSRTDCVGFVLRWRARLIATGVPEADLVIANFHTPQGWHAALLVRRPDGQWVLDNMARGPYRWVPPKGWFERAPDGRVIALHGNEVRIAIP